MTPASAHARRLSLSSLSPEVSFQGKNSKRSLADIAENWRTRANENGIRVASGESHFADDEGELCGAPTQRDGITHICVILCDIDDEQGEIEALSFFASDKGTCSCLVTARTALTGPQPSFLHRFSPLSAEYARSPKFSLKHQ